MTYEERTCTRFADGTKIVTVNGVVVEDYCSCCGEHWKAKCPMCLDMKTLEHNKKACSLCGKEYK